MSESLDMSPHIQAKSDQLNADDLVGGAITVQVLDVSATGASDQPVSVSISGGHQPWKPCKTMRRLLVAAWGNDASKWKGRWMRLFRDARVKWAGVEVGGIRVSALSDIDPGGLCLSLAVTRGKKVPHTVEFLVAPKTAQQTPPADDLERTMESDGLLVTLSLRIEACTDVESLEAVAKDMAAAVKEKMTAEHAGELREKYRAKKKELE